MWYNLQMLKNKSFTLIELLVVISIIGVLAAIVLVNMQESKKTGQDGSIIESLTQIKNAAELQYNYEYTYINICDAEGNLNTSGNPAEVDFARITEYINNRGGAVICRDSETGWAAASSLNKGGCWCVDSQGRSKKFDLGSGQTCGDVLTAGMITCP
ncbi:MAG: type II secretion system protein [bacterium]|nr:type II secretion system protein [bacterium]